MKQLMNKKVFRIVSMIIITVLLSNVYTLPALAGGMQNNNNQGRLVKFILAVTGGCTAAQILNMIQKAYPMSNEKAAEMLLAIDKLLSTELINDSGIEPAQSDACGSAAFLFMAGLSCVLISMILYETLTQEEKCVEESCLGNFCVCEKKEVTNPLSGTISVLRSAGNLMMVFGVISSVQNCVLNSGVADAGASK